MSNESKPKPSVTRNPFIIGIIVALGFWGLNLVFGLLSSCGDFGAKLGDSFGVVNALFSSVAVAGALYAVILQSQEIKEARLDRQSAEKSESNKAQARLHSIKIQSKTALIQAQTVMLDERAKMRSEFQLKLSEISRVMPKANELLNQLENITAEITFKDPGDIFTMIKTCFSELRSIGFLAPHIGMTRNIESHVPAYLNILKDGIEYGLGKGQDFKKQINLINRDIEAARIIINQIIEDLAAEVIPTLLSGPNSSSS